MANKANYRSSIDIMSYFGTFLQSSLYYIYYILSPPVLEFLFIRLYSNFSILPAYIRHTIVSFTSQTLWHNYFENGYDTFPDITAAKFLMNKTTRSAESTLFHIVSIILGAVLAAISLASAEPFTKGTIISISSLVTRIPSQSLNASGKRGLTILQSISAFDPMNKLFLSEVFFSFIYSFTSFTYVSSRGVTGLSELKRFISGSLAFLSALAVGKRATLHLGYTTVVAAFHRDWPVLLFLGLANLIGFIIAYIVFKVQSKGGPIHVVSANAARLYKRFRSFTRAAVAGKKVDNAVRQPAEGGERATATASNGSSKRSKSGGEKESTTGISQKQKSQSQSPRRRRKRVETATE